MPRVLPVRFVIGLALAVLGYYLWQVVGEFVWFFTYCCGTSGDWATKPIGVGCVGSHLALLSWLFWRRILYKTWPAWAASVGVVLGLGLYTYYRLGS